MKNSLIIILFLLLLSSCKSKEIVNITRTESIDTTITVKGDNMEFLSPLQALLEPKVYETSLQRITLQFNPVSENISVHSEIKDQNIDVKLNKEVTETTETEKRIQPNTPKFRRLFHFTDALLIIALLLVLAGTFSIIRSLKR